MAKPLDMGPIPPPAPEHRRSRAADCAPPGRRRMRHDLLELHASPSPVGDRTRVSLPRAEAAALREPDESVRAATPPRRLSRGEVEAERLSFTHAVRAFGAAMTPAPRGGRARRRPR
jgi:hypothetical protein